MNRNNVIMIGLMVVIFSLAISFASAAPGFSKDNSSIVIKAGNPVYVGDSIKIKLVDSSDNPIANQSINVSITDEDNSSSPYSLVTNQKGVAKLKMDKEEGQYVIKADFNGTDEINGNSTSKKINVEEKAVEDETSSDDDPGAFYSAQAGRVIYTGEIQEGPDGHTYKHLGYNEWQQIG